MRICAFNFVFVCVREREKERREERGRESERVFIATAVWVRITVLFDVGKLLHSHDVLGAAKPRPQSLYLRL